MLEPSILAETITTASGHQIGVFTLNAPKAMNAVDLDMVNQIDEQFRKWQEKVNVVAVLLRGAGDKAFCAGGDIRKLYNSMKAQGEEHLSYADAFFLGEYRKNYHLHLFNKPLIAWGNGFVMGGGLGLFIAANHRVGTETLKLAWPEIRIGLFPDVAATWYLSHLPKPFGHWMGLSGSHMNAVDCKQLKLTNYALNHNQQQQVIDGLLQLDWKLSNAENHRQVRALLQGMEQQATGFPKSELNSAERSLKKLFKELKLEKIDQAMRAHEGKNPWLQQGIQNYLNGCPATAHIIMRQLEEGARMSLKEAVQWELEMAYQSVRHPDFAEGIRAMVVDKDFQPKWQHANIQQVPREWVNEMTHFYWPDKHPLQDM
ncbi:MAG: enoyl-CoA hydratase/isomerase family protein [Venatoribacter sp.]